MYRKLAWLHDAYAQIHVCIRKFIQGLVVLPMQKWFLIKCIQDYVHSRGQLHALIFGNRIMHMQWSEIYFQKEHYLFHAPAFSSILNRYSWKGRCFKICCKYAPPEKISSQFANNSHKCKSNSWFVESIELYVISCSLST